MGVVIHVRSGLGNNEAVQGLRLHTEFGLGLLHTTMQELWLYPQAILLVSLAAVALCHFHLHLLLRVLLSAAQFLGF